MIEVSGAWKRAHTQMLLPESFVEIRLDVANGNISGTVTSDNSASFSRDNLIWNADKRMSGNPYALLEYNMWTLDGSKEIAQNESALAASSRFVSSDDSYEVKVVLTPSNRVTEEIPGLTITWSGEYNEYATDFTVIFKNGSTVIDKIYVTDNKSVTSVVDVPVSNFTSVEIYIYSWSLPLHRFRIDSVKFGKVLVFDKNQIISYTHEMSGDPLGTELSKNAITFELDNSDGRWNIMNPAGMGKYLYERQRLTVYYGLQIGSGIEWIQAGAFFLSEWKAPANAMVATFTARDAIEFMLNASYSRNKTTATTIGFMILDTYNSVDDLNSWYDGNDVRPVSTLAPDRAYDIYEFAYAYSEADKDNFLVCRTEHGWISADCFDLLRKIYAEADLLYALYSCLPSDGKSFYLAENIRNKLAPLIIPETPVSQLVQQCAASCGATIWQGADGVLRIQHPTFRGSDYQIMRNVCYSHPEVELTKPIRNIRIIHHDEIGEPTNTPTEIAVNTTGEDITVDCAYMFKDEDPYTWDVDLPEELVENYTNWLKHREVVSGEFRADPRLELFDTVTVESRFGEITPVVITNLKYTYDGSFHATFTGRRISADLLEEV